MSDEQHNPFQSPEAEQAPQMQLNVDADVQKKFKQQLQALVALWVIIGFLAIGVGVFVLFFQDLQAMDEAERTTLQITAAVSIVLNSIWFIAAIAAAKRKIWGMYLGLVMSYISLITLVLSLNVCMIILFIFVIIQGHRVIKWAKTARQVEPE
ncbi:MAG: hypothetical protein COA78_02295 [Blastopirellula sp.]|nr:MAG: hypothetical protein COA78_02295 [Blastopirellula sp.]